MMMPKSSAPRLIRLALTRICTMPVKVNNMDSGMMSAVISAARRLPRNRNRIATTSAAPSIRFFLNVAMALSTRLVRSYTVTAFTPGGRLLLITCMRSCTACATARLFSPISMNTVPSTTSRPLSVAAPVRSSRPRPTSARSRTRIGWPCADPTMTSRISAMPPTCPGARIRYCSPWRSI
ncbi:hypothetical protein SDC9_147203 [bioreactor metagenome]|uniref:Uncharacterized protein n=1 Tax=bioreactor metagenome TaxID=1076179 RepID=A0A645EFW1_9ZZZZ